MRSSKSNDGSGYQQRTLGRSSDWSEDECFFAVWAYDQLDTDRDQVKRELYRRVSHITGRSEKAVEYKMDLPRFGRHISVTQRHLLPV